MELSSFLSLSGRVPVNILPPRRDFGELLASCITLAGTGASDFVFSQIFLPSIPVLRECARKILFLAYHHTRRLRV